MNAGILGAGITAVAAIAVALVAMVSARSVARTGAENARKLAEREADAARSKVEAEAYERARVAYERIVADLERQVERAQQTLALVQDQLAKEQEVSGTLRGRVWAMEEQIQRVGRELEQSRALMAEHHGALRADLRKAGVDLPGDGEGGP